MHQAAGEWNGLTSYRRRCSFRNNVPAIQLFGRIQLSGFPFVPLYGKREGRPIKEETTQATRCLQAVLHPRPWYCTGRQPTCPRERCSAQAKSSLQSLESSTKPKHKPQGLGRAICLPYRRPALRPQSEQCRCRAEVDHLSIAWTMLGNLS